MLHDFFFWVDEVRYEWIYNSKYRQSIEAFFSESELIVIVISCFKVKELYKILESPSI